MMILKRTKRNRLSLSLIEVIIVSILLILILSTMGFGFIQYYRDSAVKIARKEVESLLSQAEYLYMVTQQNLTVVLQQEEEEWSFTLKPWGAIPTEKIPMRCVKLKNISSVSLNDRSIQSLTFDFTPPVGAELSTFEVVDESGRTLNALKLGLFGGKDIIIHMKNKNPKHSCYINLARYIPNFIHEPIPEDSP